MASSLASASTGAPPDRRFLTIVFSDLVDYTQLSGEIDAEDLHLVQQKYQQVALEIVESYGGFVANFSGDGILIYFGYPVARENDAERAVRAALELVSTVRELDHATTSRPSLRLKVRVGLHTGQVLLASEQASGGIIEHAAIGQAVNLASRLQELAPPNSVLVSRDTLELVEGLFDTTPLGLRSLKGLTHPVVVHEILRPRSNTRRNSSRFRRGATRTVGREEVIGMMRGCWAEVQAQNSHLVMVLAGEAGLGKTRLAMDLDREVEHQQGYTLRINCHELFSGTPLYAIAAELWAKAGVETGDNELARSEKLSNLLKRVDLSDSKNIETASSLIETLGVPGRRMPEAVPVGIKKRQFDLLLAFLRAIAGRRPLLLWVEDAHWIDPSSAELLTDLSAQLADSPILLLVTARNLPDRLLLPRVRHIQLSPLSDDECMELARSVPGSESLSREVLDDVVRSADGNPLFVEQLTLSLIDNEGRPRSDNERAALPLTLAELMSERLDRLPGGRRVVQAAACLGRSFTQKFVDLLLESEPGQNAAILEKLVRADILRVQQDTTAEARYEFRHALLQSAAHDSLVKSERKVMHTRIAQALASGDWGPVISEVHARHLMEAGHAAEAISAWLLAGITATRRSAYVEAIAHIERGLSLLAAIPDPAAREKLEIGLQAALIGPFSASAGPTSEKMLKCCQRGLQLCKPGQPSPLVFAFLFGQFSHAVCRGNGALAMTSAELFQSTATAVKYESGKVIGHRMLGLVRLGRGNVAEAVHELTASLRLYSAERDEAATHVFGQNTQVHSRSLLSLSLLHAGRIDEALQIGFEALHSIDELKHPHSSALALGYVGGWVFGMCGAAEQQMQAARRLVTLAEEHHLRSFCVFGQAFIGWALCKFGNLQQGIPILEKAVDDLESVNFRLSASGHMAFLADAMRLAGRLSDAAELCDRGLEYTMEAGERLHEPELRRVRAMVEHDMRGHLDDVVRKGFEEAAASARALALPLCEHRVLRTMVSYLGASGLSATTVERLKELSHLDDWEERAATIVRSAYPVGASLL